MKKLTGIAQLTLRKIETPEKRQIAAPEGSKAYFKTSVLYPHDLYCSKGLLVDDLITQADSKLEALDVLNNEMGLFTKSVVVLVDREQGGKEQLEKRGYKLKSIFSLTKDLLSLYVENKKITQEKADEVIKYIAENQTA